MDDEFSYSQVDGKIRPTSTWYGLFSARTMKMEKFQTFDSSKVKYRQYCYRVSAYVTVFTRRRGYS